METVTVTFTDDNIGNTVNEGCIFFEKSVKPLVTDDTKELQFDLEADLVSPSFLLGVFMNVIDLYIVGRGENDVKISFDDPKVYAFFGTVAAAFSATLDMATDTEEEQEQDFLS